jgi:Flp pilus assembly protein TadG
MALIVRSLIEALRRGLFARRSAGIAAIEFALLAPVFVMVFAGTIDVGNALYIQTLLDSAVAAGTNYALVFAASVTANTNPSTGTALVSELASKIATIVSTSNGGTAANTTVVVNNGPSVSIAGGLKISSGTTSNANLCYCPTGSPPSWTWGSSVTCGNGCTGGGTAGKFVTVTASYSITPFFPAYTFVRSGTMTMGSAAQTQ